ncbi:MAG TPA: helix-turn-helix domain-containing protein, partial [Dissulfurispiraceae bacterium]|nr:helix-turn-helix domain-containing protein [Dissulfurispiraceae bacterium]
MKTGRPKKPLILNDEERKQLESILSSRSLPVTIVRRACIILCSADNMPNDKIAGKLGVTPYTVGHWRRRFMQYGLAGLYGESRPGRPRIHDDDEVMRLLQTVIEEKPANATHWSMRTLAKKTGIPKSVVHRYCELFGVQPHRS